MLLKTIDNNTIRLADGMLLAGCKVFEVVRLLGYGCGVFA
jgi:hypothetical protein